MRKSLEPWLIEAVTASGKSHIVAALAHTFREQTGKRVLSLQPSKELLDQNREKYLGTGNPASVFSAAAGSRCMRHDVVFGTPGTVKNHVGRFKDFGLVMLDEAHGVTPTIKHIVSRMRESNPNLRVGGLTATPYRLGTGYIYRMDEHNNAMDAIEPFFHQRVATVTAYELLQNGWLTPITIGNPGGSYDTSGLVLKNNGQFDSASVDRAFVGKGRKTSKIVADVVAQSAGRNGVMLFAATIPHAHEVMASLPPELSAIVTGQTSKTERAQVLRDFKAGRLKYLVNVAVLTTGFDAPHVDVVALLRATESVGLLQQIIGRGMRLHEGKRDCILLDYAGNIERHCPDGDIFNPNISTRQGGGSASIEVKCPQCECTNTFAARKNPDGFAMNEEGYFVDLAGNPMEIPAHHGRRCFGHFIVGGTAQRCTYRWTCKECVECGHDNDIAARYCEKCKEELVDPNEKLVLDFERHKKNPRLVQVDELVSMQVRRSVSQAGNQTIVVTYTTPYRSFTCYYTPSSKARKAQSVYALFMAKTRKGTHKPDTITYCKEGDFYIVTAFDEAKDEVPEVS